MAPDTGDLAPDFTLPEQRGEQVSLSGFRGQTVVPSHNETRQRLDLVAYRGRPPVTQDDKQNSYDLRHVAPGAKRDSDLYDEDEGE